MFVLIYFSRRSRSQRKFPYRKGKASQPLKASQAQKEKLKAQIRRARAKFHGKYNDFLLYLNKMAAVAALQSIGIVKKKQNGQLIRDVLNAASADFNNLISTSKPLTPKHKLGLVKSLGPQRAQKFLANQNVFRKLIFAIDDALVAEEKQMGFKDN